MMLARLIFSFYIIVSVSFALKGQSQDPDKTNLKSIEKYYELAQIIPGPDKQVKKSPFQIIEELIFGKEDLHIVRPADIIHAGKEKGWILSQDNGIIIKYEGRKLGLAKIKNKNHHQFKSLVSGCYIPSIGLVFTDSAEEMIYVLNDEGNLSRFIDDGMLLRPTGIAYNSINQTIWVVESGGHRISIFSTEGNLIKRIGERGSETGQFNFPTHIDIDAKGSVFVVDAMNFRIQIFDNEGRFISMFGEHGDATGKFARPKGIAVDSEGNIFVADALFNNIQVFNNEGFLLYYFGSKGSGKEEFLMPAGIDIDDNDYIYVSDSYNNRIQIFKPSIRRLSE